MEGNDLMQIALLPLLHCYQLCCSVILSITLMLISCLEVSFRTPRLASRRKVPMFKPHVWNQNQIVNPQMALL